MLQSDGLAQYHGQPHAPGTEPPPDPDPDARLGDNIADVVAPYSKDVEQVRKAVRRKVEDGQAFHIALSLARTRVTRQKVEAILRRKPIQGLRELFIMEQDGAIYRAFPEPSLIAPAQPSATPPATP